MIDLLQQLRRRPSVSGALAARRIAARCPGQARARALHQASMDALQVVIAGKEWWTTYEMILGQRAPGE